MKLSTQQLNLFAQQHQEQQNLPFCVGLNGQFVSSQMHPYKEGVAYTKRVPNCQKCGQHGRKSRLKGHKRVCPFKDCNCPKCQVVSERQKLMADQIKIRRRQRKDTLLNITREKITATLNAAAAVAAAGPLPYLNNLNMIYKQFAQNQPADEQQQQQQQQATMVNQIAPSQTPPTSGFRSLTTSTPSTPNCDMHLQSTPNTFVSLANTNTANNMNSPTNGFTTLSNDLIKPLAPELAVQVLEQSMSPPQKQIELSSGLHAILQGLQPQLSTSPILSHTQATSPASSYATMSPPQSAGLVAPVPINPALAPTTVCPNEQLLQLLANVQLIYQQQQQQQQQALNQNDLQHQVERLMMAAAFAQQSHLTQGKKTTDGAPARPDSPNYVDVCSV